MTDHRRLEIWRRARELSRRVYFVVQALPREERFRRGDQIIRAACSVRHNIAEGASGTDAEFANYLRKSLCSANETHDELDDLDGIGLLGARDQEYLDLGAMIAAFRKRVRARVGFQKKARGECPAPSKSLVPRPSPQSLAPRSAYSSRRATTGSTLVARIAGTSVARNAIPMSSADTRPNVIGSVAPMPNS